MSRRALLMVLLLGGTLSGCTCGTMDAKEFDRRYPIGRGTILTSAGIQELVAAVHRRLGPTVRIRDLSLYPDYASFVAQDPKRPDHFDSYTWRCTRGFDQPRPEKNSRRPADEQLFDFDQVPFAQVPGMLRQAGDLLDLEDGVCKYVIVGLDDGQLRLRVYCAGPRDSDTVVFGSDGKVRTRGM